MKNKIIFFTRVPKVGTTKTRLYDFVSPETAVEIQKKLMRKNYDILKNSYVSNMLEYVNLINDSSINMYKLLKLCLEKIEDDISEKLVLNYYLCQILKEQGFMFKYQKTEYSYIGYSFFKSSFVDKFNIDQSVYGLNDSLVKLTYYMTVKNINFLEDLEIDNKDLLRLFSFLNILFKEFIGIETKSYTKILELEEMLSSN